jgi:hypothetical protein
MPQKQPPARYTVSRDGVPAWPVVAFVDEAWSDPPAGIVDGAEDWVGEFGVMAGFLGRRVDGFEEEARSFAAAGAVAGGLSAAEVRIPDNASQAVIKDRVAIQRRMRDG